jgi:hypothetical protein
MIVKYSEAVAKNKYSVEREMTWDSQEEVSYENLFVLLSCKFNAMV